MLPLCADRTTVAPFAMFTAPMEPDCASWTVPASAFSPAMVSEPLTMSVPDPDFDRVAAPALTAPAIVLVLPWVSTVADPLKLTLRLALTVNDPDVCSVAPLLIVTEPLLAPSA